MFILSGAEDLVVVGPSADGGIQYRPRTEGLFATIVHHRGGGQDYWLVTGKDVWVPEMVLTAVDLPLRRPSQSNMIRRWR